LLRRVKGFGEKTEENILRAIELVKEGEARTFLVDAARIVDAITQGMKATKTVERIEAAGSFRRMRETVGDVDILAVAKNRAAAGAAFERLPGVVEVLASGETKVVVRLEYHDYEDPGERSRWTCGSSTRIVGVPGCSTSRVRKTTTSGCGRWPSA